MRKGNANQELVLLRNEATVLAGRTGDLTQRASVYHHLYAHSGGNHCFPLLAAHGALWASGYFRKGMKFGSVMAACKSLVGFDRALLLQGLHQFAEDFRDINRRVCVETFFIYWLTSRAHLRDEAERIVPVGLFEEMDRCHTARRAGRMLDDDERRRLFTAFFLWEQANIVGPSIDQAFAKFDWPLIRKLALRPKIDFSYFGGRPLVFSNFGDGAERIEMGIRAFDRACDKSWHEVERSLAIYGIMPTEFAADPASFFRSLTQSLLPPTTQPLAFA